MDSDLLKPVLSGLAKQAITALGVYLGLTGTEQTQFVGAGMVIAGVAWEWWEQRGKRLVIATLAKMKPVASEGASTAAAAKAGLDAAKQELAK